MASFTKIGTGNMRRTFSRSRHAIVTTNTGLSTNGTVIKRRYKPIDRGMTVFANVCGLDMGWMLTGGSRTVMAARTGTQHLVVVNRRNWRPGIGAVAIFADVAGLDVCGSLARCIHAVVATEAVTRNIDVVEVRRDPARCRVTIVAGIPAGDMRGVLACRDETVVTRGTGADDLGMVHHGGR